MAKRKKASKRAVGRPRKVRNSPPADGDARERTTSESMTEAEYVEQLSKCSAEHERTECWNRWMAARHK